MASGDKRVESIKRVEQEAARKAEKTCDNALKIAQSLEKMENDKEKEKKRLETQAKNRKEAETALYSYLRQRELKKIRKDEKN